MALKTKISYSLEAILSAAIDLGARSAPVNAGRSFNLADGSGLNQANLVYADRFTITASGSQAIDLAGGGLLGPDGLALASFARIKGVAVQADANNTNNINVVRDGTNGVPLFLALGDGIPVLPNGIFLWVAPSAAGIAVTAGTGDLLNLVNSAGGTSVTGDICIIGASS